MRYACLTSLGVILILYVVGCVALYLLQERLIFYPEQLSPDQATMLLLPRTVPAIGPGDHEPSQATSRARARAVQPDSFDIQGGIEIPSISSPHEGH